MDNELDIAKSKLDNVGIIRDIYENPVVQFIVESLSLFPFLNSLVNETFKKAIAEYQNKKQEDIFRLIFEDNKITLEDVNSVEVIIEFAKMLDVIKKLANNKKLKYFAALFRGYVLQENRDSDLYEEYLYRLDELSFREIHILYILHDCGLILSNKERLAHEELIEQDRKISLAEKYWEEFKVKVVQDAGINENDIESYLQSISKTGFCIEFRQGLIRAAFMFATTVYFENFIEMQSV